MNKLTKCQLRLISSAQGETQDQEALLEIGANAGNFLITLLTTGWSNRNAAFIATTEIPVLIPIMLPIPMTEFDKTNKT